MAATDRQVQIMIRERKKGRTQEQAAAKANLKSRQTVAKYEQSGQLPSEMKEPRRHRTRQDPFADDWPAIEALLQDAPGLQPKTVFEWLREQHPGKYRAGQVRTLQRRIAQWKALHLTQLASLPQIRQPGAMMQTDGTHMNELQITIDGQPFAHLLIHCVLPYSNWQWARVVQSESLPAVRLGVESALRELGYVPRMHQTDPSSAATRQLGLHETSTDGHRPFTSGYLSLLQHYGMEGGVTHVASPDENGDVEAANGALKRAIEQHLLLRGSRDFADIPAYEAFLFAIMRRRNALRQPELDDELAVMRPLTVAPMETRRKVRVRVSQTGLIRVDGKSYSVPTGLMGQRVSVWIDEWDLTVYLGTEFVERLPRIVGSAASRVNYRHIIDTLLRKPGGFRHYRYRNDLFPTRTFRQAWEQLNRWYAPRQADIHYLHILKLAARELECDVEAALKEMLSGDAKWQAEDIRQRLALHQPAVPTIKQGQVDLHSYDHLLPHSGVHHVCA